MATPRLVGVVVGDEPAAWHTLGFPVAGDRFTVGGVTVRLVGTAGGRGILGWQLDPPVGVLDGLPAADATGTTAPAQERVTPANGGGDAAVALDHVVASSRDVERTTAALEAVGIAPRRTVDGARGDDGVRYRFFVLGTCVLELIGPVVPTGDDRPARFRGLAFTAADLTVFTAVTGPPRPAVQPGRSIVTLDTGAHDVSVPVAVLTPRPARDG